MARTIIIKVSNKELNMMKNAKQILTSESYG